MTINERRDGHDRREDQFRIERTRVTWTVVVWILGVVITALMTYNATANTVNDRVGRLEAKQESTEQRLQRIETKIDELLMRGR